MKIQRHARIAIMGGTNRVYPRWDVVHGHDAQWGLQTRMIITQETYEAVPGLLRIRAKSEEHCTWCRLMRAGERTRDQHPRDDTGRLKHSQYGCYYRIEVPEHNGKRVRFQDIGQEYCREEFDPWDPFTVFGPMELALDEERWAEQPMQWLRNAAAISYADLEPFQLFLPADRRRKPFAGPTTWEWLARDDTARKALEVGNQNREILHARAYRLDWENMERQDFQRITEGRIVTLNLRDFEALMVRKGASEVATARAIFEKTLNEFHVDYAWEQRWWETQLAWKMERKFGWAEFMPHGRPGLLRIENGRVNPTRQEWRRHQREQQKELERPAAKLDWIDRAVSCACGQCLYCAAKRTAVEAKAQQMNWQTPELETGAQQRTRAA